MCGRYELHAHPAAVALVFGLRVTPDLAPRYNIAPMQQVPIVRKNRQGENELVEVRWGLVPRWARDPTIGTRMINARAETLTQRSAFRDLFRRHRCLLPADGFYEWKAVNGGKQATWVGMKSGQPFGLAGLYERWLSRDGEVLDTCTIITTEANALLRDVHDRMPLIVAPEDHERWLDSGNDDVADLLAPHPSDDMTWHPVSKRVNAVRNDDASLIERVEEASAIGADAPDDEESAEETAPVQASLL